MAEGSPPTDQSADPDAEARSRIKCAVSNLTYGLDGRLELAAAIINSRTLLAVALEFLEGAA